MATVFDNYLAITGVRFEDADGAFSVHTRDDYGMFLATRPEIDPPKPKIVSVNIPGSDGVLDLTESVNGEVAYENRTIRLEFAKQLHERSQASFMSMVNGALHGKRLRMYVDKVSIYPRETDYYYEGRVSVAWTNQSFWKLHCVITIDAIPYKLEDEETTVTLTNSDVEAQSPLSVTIHNWRDVYRDKNINSETRRLEFGTETFPSNCFYAFEWVEIVFEKQQYNKSVDITAYDSRGHSWTYTDNVKTRNNPVTGRGEAYVYYPLTYATSNGVNTRTIYRIDVGTNSASQNTDKIAYVAKINAKVTSDYGVWRISTMMPCYPEVVIETTATNGFYFTWNGKGYNSLEFTTDGNFAGTDPRLRLVRGQNVITLRPRDASVDNKISFTFQKGLF